MLLPRAARVPDPKAYGRVVYVAQCETSGRLKVGYTRDLRSRISSLQSAPEAEGVVRLVAWWAVPYVEKPLGHYEWMKMRWTPRNAEMDLHGRLHRWLFRGEWFHGTDAALALVRRFAARKWLPLPPKAAWVSDIGPKFRRRWLEAFYDTFAETGSYARARRAGDETRLSSRRVASLKQQINTLRWQNARLAERKYVPQTSAEAA